MAVFRISMAKDNPVYSVFLDIFTTQGIFQISMSQGQILGAKEFVDTLLKENWLLLDTRSENEFLHAHIPGAKNLPLLNNEHRHIIGTTYKKEGREVAVRKGFELVGPLFHDFIRQVSDLTSN